MIYYLIMMIKIIIILIDGVGDVSIDTLSNTTPLQHATLPNLDICALSGICGMMDPVAPGLACGSDTAHLSLLGYPPVHCYRGRGAFESMGADLPMVKGDIAFKSNFATLDMSTRTVVKRRCDRNFPEWGVPLCAALCDLPLPSFPNIQLTVKHATEHRCGVRLRGPNLVDTINGTDPLKDNLPLQVASAVADDEHSRYTAKVVNEVTEVIIDALHKHPINVRRREEGQSHSNVVLLRGCGGRIDVPSFHDLHGYHGFMIAPTAIIAGLGMSIEMDVLRVAGTTGDYHTDLLAKSKAAAATLLNDENHYNFGFLHIKAVDDAGHDKNVNLKVDWLQRVDTMVGDLMERVKDDNVCVVITGDHSTPVLYGDHSCQPVPVVLCPTDACKAQWQNRWSDLLASDGTRHFTELDCARGGVLGRFPGHELMPLIHRLVDDD